MRTAKSTWQRATLVLGSLLGLCSSGVLGQSLKEVKKFDLPGPGGKRFDYLTIDADDHYLISAHLAADQTYVIDLRTNKVVATVTDTPGAEGVEYVSELKKFYTSNAHVSRFSISQMDVSTRQSYTIAVVWPEERCAAGGIAGVARTAGAATSPILLASCSRVPR